PQQGLGAGQAITNITNIADRLVADQTSSALWFRGYPDEQDRVAQLLTLIDRPNTLRYEQYYAGPGAVQIAQLGERLGLGHVETVESQNQGNTTPNQPQQITFQAAPGQRGGNPIFNFNNPTQQTQTASVGGPVMIVDTARDMIIYYGTEDQHRQ